MVADCGLWIASLLVMMGVGIVMEGVIVSVMGFAMSVVIRGETLFSRFPLFSLYHNSRLSSPLAKNAFTMSDGIPCHSNFPLSATASAAENVFLDHASRRLSISGFVIAYLCLDCSMIFFVCSPDHSGVGSGIVFIEKGSEVTPLIIILV